MEKMRKNNKREKEGELVRQSRKKMRISGEVTCHVHELVRSDVMGEIIRFFSSGLW